MELFDRHLAERVECKSYQDNLPSFEDVVNALHNHECVYGTCTCICGCQEATGCQLVFGGRLCTGCHIAVVRDDDEHGEPDTQPTSAGRGDCDAT